MLIDSAVLCYAYECIMHSMCDGLKGYNTGFCTTHKAESTMSQ